MKRIPVFLELSLIFLLAACSGTVSPPTKLPPALTQTPAFTPAPSSTASPMPSSTASSTPFPPLSGNKPYLMLVEPYIHQELFIYDEGGNNQTVKLPSEGNIRKGYGDSLFKLSVSPDGKWVAFYTGSIASWDADNLPLTLNLLNIADGTVRKVADVVTQGYLQKLSDVTDQLKTLFPDKYKANDDGDWANRSVVSAFQTTIYSIAWSPDSRSLAFAGQMDGISSDVYLYDLGTGDIQRVEDTLQSVSEIQWSPDGKYIVFQNSIPGQVYTGSSLYAVKLGKTVVKNPKSLQSGYWWILGDWLSSSRLLFFQAGDGGGIFDLQSLNINTGQTSDLWKGNFGSYAIDAKNQNILLNSYDPNVSEHTKKDGLYLINFSGTKNKISSNSYYRLEFRRGAKHSFWGLGIDFESVFGIAKDGSTTLLTTKANPKFSISPDHSWMVIYNDQGMELFDKDDLLVKTLSIAGIEGILWWPDSKVVFYSTGQELYSLSVPAGELKVVDECRSSNCSFDLDDAAWLP